MHADTLTFTLQCDFFTGPEAPANVSPTVTDKYTAVLTWTASQSKMCDVVIGNYSVRYQLSNATGDYTTVYTPNTSVSLQDLVPNADYLVSVAAINSNGNMSNFSANIPFTTSPGESI